MHIRRPLLYCKVELQYSCIIRHYGTHPQGLLKQLSELEDTDEMSAVTDKALQQLHRLRSSPSRHGLQHSVTSQLHSCGVKLWNRAVTLKSAGATPLTLTAQREIPFNHKVTYNLPSPPYSETCGIECGSPVQSRPLLRTSPHETDYRQFH